jgi:hypothetical protein
MKLAILVLAVSATVYGQAYNQRVMSGAQNQNLPAGSNLTIGPPPGYAMPPSVKCGKYEHADPVQWACGQPCTSDSTCVATWGCSWTTSKCVDDIHVVTEKEWQVLLSLAAEKPRNVDSANETHVLPTCKGQECADAEHSCKPGFIYDKDFELCMHHFVDHAGNSCWTGQDNSGVGCSMKQPPFKDSDGNFVLGITGPGAHFTGCHILSANLPSYQGASETYRCDQGAVTWTWATINELATPTPGTKLPPNDGLAYAEGAASIESLTSSAGNTVVLAAAGSMERIELPTTGDVILVAYDKEDKRTLTVYRDGHILAEGADPDEITKRFWRLFADAERAALPACKK